MSSGKEGVDPCPVCPGCVCMEVGEGGNPTGTLGSTTDGTRGAVTSHPTPSTALFGGPAPAGPSATWQGLHPSLIIFHYKLPKAAVSLRPSFQIRFPNPGH